MKKIKNFVEKYYDYTIIAVIYFLLHLFMHTDYWDDISTTTVFAEYNYNLIEYISWVYHNWSSRIIIQGIWAIIGFLPNIIWKVIDVIMIVLLYHFISELVKLLLGNNEKKSWSRNWQLLIFMSFPYSLMGTAGWMTTTIVYTWTFALFAYAMCVILRASYGSKISGLTYGLYGLALMFAANFNITSISLLIIFALMYIVCTKNRAFNILFIEGMAITIFNLVLFIVAPGNKNRMAYDAIYHDTAELMELSLFHKLRMGINSTFYHFISVPNAILFISCVVLLMAVWLKTDNLFKRIIGSIPLLLDIAWTGYVFVAYTLKNRFLTYIYPDGAFEVCTKQEQYLAMGSAIFMIFCMIYTIALVTDFSKLSWAAVCCLVVFGLLPEIALGFTTTVSASIIRMTSFFYFALIICSNIVVEHCNVLKMKWYKIALVMFCVAGGLFNILQMIRHILVYG